MPTQCPPVHAEPLIFTDPMKELAKTNAFCYISSQGGDREALRKCCNTTEGFVSGAKGYDECHYSVPCGQAENLDDFDRISDEVDQCYPINGDNGLIGCLGSGIEGAEGSEEDTSMAPRLKKLGGLLVAMAMVASVGPAL